jgi:hypothetical protein
MLAEAGVLFLRRRERWKPGGRPMHLFSVSLKTYAMCQELFFVS